MARKKKDEVSDTNTLPAAAQAALNRLRSQRQSEAHAARVWKAVPALDPNEEGLAGAPYGGASNVGQVEATGPNPDYVPPLFRQARLIAEAFTANHREGFAIGVHGCMVEVTDVGDCAALWPRGAGARTYLDKAALIDAAALLLGAAIYLHRGEPADERLS